MCATKEVLLSLWQVTRSPQAVRTTETCSPCVLYTGTKPLWVSQEPQGSSYRTQLLGGISACFPAVHVGSV